MFKKRFSRCDFGRCGECVGLTTASFGTGLIMARILPCSLIVIAVAAAMIALGLWLRKK